MLHVSQHARQEGFRYYTKISEWNPQNHPKEHIQAKLLKKGGETHESTIIYVNFDVDYFKFGSPNTAFLQCQRAKARRIFAPNIPSAVTNKTIRGFHIQGQNPGFGLGSYGRSSLDCTKWTTEALEEVTIHMKPHVAESKSGGLIHNLERARKAEAVLTRIKHKFSKHRSACRIKGDLPSFKVVWDEEVVDDNAYWATWW